MDGIKIKFDHNKKIAIITKKLDKSSETFDSDEYNVMAKLRKDYPDYTIEFRNIGNKQTHKGLTFDLMEMYISAQPNKQALMTEYNKIKEYYEEEEKKEQESKSEKEQNKIKKEMLLKRYTQTKAWFVEKFPKYHKTPQYKLIISETKDNDNASAVNDADVEQ